MPYSQKEVKCCYLEFSLKWSRCNGSADQTTSFEWRVTNQKRHNSTIFCVEFSFSNMTLFWILCSVSCSLPIFGVNNVAASASWWNSQRVYAILIVRGEHDKMTKKKISLSIIMVVAAVIVMEEAYRNLFRKWREKWVNHIMAQLFLLRGFDSSLLLERATALLCSGGIVKVNLFWSANDRTSSATVFVRRDAISSFLISRHFILFSPTNFFSLYIFPSQCLSSSLFVCSSLFCSSIFRRPKWNYYTRETKKENIKCRTHIWCVCINSKRKIV